MACIYGKRWEGIGKYLGEGGQAHVLRVKDRTRVPQRRRSALTGRVSKSLILEGVELTCPGRLSIQIFAWLCFGQRSPEQEGGGLARCTKD
jgi:hypothetical protein